MKFGCDIIISSQYDYVLKVSFGASNCLDVLLLD